MKVLITGASGMIGSALQPRLAAAGHEVVPLARGRNARSAHSWWDPATGEVDDAALDGATAIVHLAGENIGAARWTRRKKEAIRASRVRPTRLLAEFLAGSSHCPPVLVAASGISYYGDAGDRLLTEKAPPGEGYLALVCRDWEAATAPLAAAGTRVVMLRNAPVLSLAGGALAKMLPPFRFGVGGVIGDGTQYMSWVHIDDEVGIIIHALATDDLSGPVNAASPNPVTNREFTRTLGRVLARPTVMPLPAFLVRALFGEVADEMLLVSTRVVPERLLASGYRFRYEALENALRILLGR
jgi:uncharacterized protein (TIGR01777 family)